MTDAAFCGRVMFGLRPLGVFGGLWLSTLAGIIGAFVIASWSRGLIRDTDGILLDINPDLRVTLELRTTIRGRGRPRLGPPCLAAGT